MTHIAYKGSGSATIAHLSGEISAQFPSLPTAMSYVKSNRLRALGVTTAKRSPYLMEVPAIGEFLPGYESFSWYGTYAPRNTPPEIVDRLNKEINAALADPKIKARIADLGGTPLTGSAAVFAKFLADETEKWAKVVKFSGSKL